MKALAIDSAANCIYVSAKNDDLESTIILNLGLRQSQELLPAIDFVLSKVNLKPSELDYMVLCAGPGTFTGLRLAYSALKAIELSFNIPVYGVPSLTAYAYKYKGFTGQVLSVIDAKKDQFFAAIFENGEEVFKAQDTDAKKVYECINKNLPIILTGPDAEVFKNELLNIHDKLNIYTFCSASDNVTPILFSMAEQMIEQKKDPIKDFEGPLYLRKSEAEIALEKK